MGLVISYDDKFATPYSEIELASGEHIFIALDREGLSLKLLARPNSAERLLFAGNPDTVAKICNGLLGEQDRSITTPLRVLVSVVTQMPNAAAVAEAFTAATKG